MRDNAELLKYAVKNERHCTAEAIKNCSHTVFGEHTEKVRLFGYAIFGQIGNRFIDEYFGLGFLLIPVERK